MTAHDDPTVGHSERDDDTDTTTATAGTSRRSVLGTAATLGSLGIAGCLGAPGESDSHDDETTETGEDFPELPRVENPPAAVYLPTHREGMMMPDPIRAGEYAVGPMITYPHPFWLVTGDVVETVEVDPTDDVHLMVTVWDPETGTVLPTDEGLSMEVKKDGELIDSRPPWSMLSQTMGFHFGDNVHLNGDGTYEVELRIPAIATERTGAFEGRFDDPATASFEFTYDAAFRESVVEMIDWLDEELWGEPGALEPGHDHGGHESGGHDEPHGDHHDDDPDRHGDGHHQEHEEGHDDNHESHHQDHDGDHHEHGDMGHVPFSQLPEAEDLPGTHQGTPVSGDADLAVTVTDAERFADGEPYLLVSPRTPYNRVPLPAMSITARVSRNGTAVAETPLGPTLDDEAGFHYGASVPDLQEADEVRLTVDAPPQTARHQGYETAFVDMEPVEVSLDGW